MSHRHLNDSTNDSPLDYYLCSRKFGCALYARSMYQRTASAINFNSGIQSVGKVWLTYDEAVSSGFRIDRSSLLVIPLTSVGLDK